MKNNKEYCVNCRSEIREITQSISEDDVEGEVNTKIGEIEEILDKLLYELR